MLWPESAQVNVESTNEIEHEFIKSKLNQVWTSVGNFVVLFSLRPHFSDRHFWSIVFFRRTSRDGVPKNFVRKCQDDVIVRLRANLSCLNQMPQSAAINCSPLSFSFVGDRRWLSKPTSKLTLGASLDRSRRPVFPAQRISPRYISIDRSTIDRSIDS
jgi:hypothetical protein